MPIYEFKCKKCGRVFEALCFTKDDERELRCPSCGNKEVEKTYSSFSTTWGRSFGFGSGSSCGGGRGFGFG